MGCDLLKNSYLCGATDITDGGEDIQPGVVICLKIRIFAVQPTSLLTAALMLASCDLLKNSYLCGATDIFAPFIIVEEAVVICLKIRIFAVQPTSHYERQSHIVLL